jgi:cytochrome c553
MAAEGQPEVGKAKAEAAGCFACHGVDGLATADGLAADKNVPNLAGEPNLYLQFQLVFFRKGVRKNEVMNAMAQQLSDDDLRDISAYYASLPGPDGRRRRTMRRRRPRLAPRSRRGSTARTATATISRGWTTWGG